MRFSRFLDKVKSASKSGWLYAGAVAFFALVALASLIVYWCIIGFNPFEWMADNWPIIIVIAVAVAALALSAVYAVLRRKR